MTLKNKEKLSSVTSIFLFAKCDNNITYALKGAKEALRIKATDKNKLIVKELEEFFADNTDYYNSLFLKIERYKIQ